MTIAEKTEIKAKKAYDFLYRCGEQHLYPELKGVWEEDMDFWIEEYLEQMGDPK